LVVETARKVGRRTGKLEDDAEARTSRTSLFLPMFGILPFHQTIPISTNRHSQLKRALNIRFDGGNEEQHQMDMSCVICVALTTSCSCRY
jgi:hypothetical protein